MKRVVQKRLFFIAIIFFLGGYFHDMRSEGADGRPSLSTYSTGFSSRLVGWGRQLQLQDTKGRTDLTLAFSAEYGSTFKSYKLAQLLFRTSSVTISGSAVPDRDMYKDWLADYFGLPRDFKSHIHFSPVVANSTFYFDGLLGLDSILEGLFCGFHVPVVNTRWDLNMSECVVDPGTAFYPAGYMGPERIDRSALAPNFTMAIQGKTISAASGQEVPFTYGDMQEPRSYGLILGRSDKTGLSDIKLLAGWKKNYKMAHAGLVLVTRLPLSNRRNGVLYFQPLLGNGKHWELGGGVTGHVDFFKKDDGQHSFGVYLDAIFSHLFSAWEKRTFNMVGLGFGNKFTLMQEIAQGNYLGRLIPAINKTALDAKIDILIKADITTKLVYIHDSINIELGYNFLANTHERLKCHGDFDVGRYALKGDAQLYGFDVHDNHPVRLTVTQHNAYLTRGQTPGNTSYQQIYSPPPPITLRTAFQNINADNTKLTPYYQLNAEDRAALDNLPEAFISESKPPILLQEKNIDYFGVLFPKALAHRFFIHVSKVFKDEDAQVRPSLGIGVSVTTAGTSFATNSAISMWGVNVGGSLYW